MLSMPAYQRLGLQGGPETSLELLKAESLQLELWPVADGTDDTALDKATRQNEVDTFFEKCFPWLSDELPDTISEPTPSSDHSHASSSFQSADPVMSRSSTASASTSETAGNCFIKQEQGIQGLGTAAGAASVPPAGDFCSNSVPVAGSTASMVSWGPPRLSDAPPQQHAAAPHSTTPATSSAFPLQRRHTAVGTMGISGMDESMDYDPAHALFHSISTGHAPSNASDPVARFQQTFLAPVAAQPSSFSDILQNGHARIEDVLRMTSAAHGSLKLGRNPSGSSAGTVVSGSNGSGGATAAGAGAPAPVAGRKGRGGRAAGGSAVKDTTRRKAAEIVRLEQEVQEKLMLATDLQKQKEELERRERLLKLQVSAGERHIFCQSTKGGITPHLKTLIQGFRSTFNQMFADDLLAQMPEDPKKFTIKEFVLTWQSFVHEIAGQMLENPGADDCCNDVCERVANWCMSVCVHVPHVMAKAQSTNMQTGEEAVPPQELWEAVIDKVELSEQQSADLCSVYLLYSSILQQTTEEFGRLAVALSQLIDKDIVRGNVLAYKSSTNICPQMAAAAEEKEHVFKKLEACSRQGSLLHTMLSFLVLSLLEPKQRAVMIFNAFPSFPNLKLILATVYRRASQRTPGIPGMSSP